MRLQAVLNLRDYIVSSYNEQCFNFNTIPQAYVNCFDFQHRIILIWTEVFMLIAKFKHMEQYKPYGFDLRRLHLRGIF